MSARALIVMDGINVDSRVPYYETLLTELYNEARQIEGNVDGEAVSDEDFANFRAYAEDWTELSRTQEDAALRRIAALTIVQLIRRKQEDYSRG